MSLADIILTVIGWILGIWRYLGAKLLTKREKELLRMAVGNEGEILVIKTDQTGEFVGIGSHDFRDKKDPEVQANYMEALRKLLNRGLVVKKSETLYCLTGTGFGKGKRLKKPDKPS